MRDLEARNEALLQALREQTDRLLADPKKLAAWAKRQRKDQEDYAAYMALDEHGGDCYCARCMSEFLHAQGMAARSGETARLDPQGNSPVGGSADAPQAGAA